MVAEKFQIDSVKVTGKYICETKKLNLFIFTHAPRQNSPPGFYHYHPGRRKSPIPPKKHFLKIYCLPSRKRGGVGALVTSFDKFHHLCNLYIFGFNSDVP